MSCIKQVLTKDFIHSKKEMRDIILNVYENNINKGIRLYLAKSINKDFSISYCIITTEDYERNMKNPVKPEDPYFKMSARFYYQDIVELTKEGIVRLKE